MQKIKKMFKKLNKPLFIVIGVILVLAAAGLIFYQQTHAIGITKYASMGNYQFCNLQFSINLQ